MNAIPTRYAGVQFRSRLEAKWAAMFDLLGWLWEYEPLDLDGYIPDFVLQFDRPMIVEVKPLMGRPHSWLRDGAALSALKKIDASGWFSHGLLLGLSPYSSSDTDGYVADGNPLNAGVLFDVWEGGTYSSVFGISACCGGPIDVIGEFTCRRCGLHDKGPTLQSTAKITALWREAGNRVQWRAPR
jgi:hypothetical protein